MPIPIGSLTTHYSITPPPSGSGPRTTNPNGAFAVDLESGPNHSLVSPTRQREIMTEAREEQFYFHPSVDTPDTFRATNPNHNFEFVHNEDGLTITPRPNSVQLLTPGSAPDWSIQYQASALVLDGLSIPFEANPPSSFENQSSSVRLTGCNEWFINSSEGLQQGFTIQQPLGDQPDSLAVRIDVNSTLSPSFNSSTRSIEFQNTSHRTLLSYRDLHVYDDTGRELPSRMSLDNSGAVPAIILEADVQDAVFPVIVDPFSSVQQGAQQMPNDVAPGDGFGSTSAGRGDHSAIGAKDKGNGVVYINRRNEGGTDNFGQVAKLEVPADESPGGTDQFGSALLFAEDEATGTEYLLIGAATTQRLRISLRLPSGRLGLDLPQATPAKHSHRRCPVRVQPRRPRHDDRRRSPRPAGQGCRLHLQARQRRATNRFKLSPTNSTARLGTTSATPSRSTGPDSSWVSPAARSRIP